MTRTALFVGMCVGFLVVLPTLLGIGFLINDWSGIYPVRNDDELFYLARTQESAEGRLFIANPYLSEFKQDGGTITWFPEYILSRPAVWFGVSVPTLFVLYDFLLPASIAFMIVMFTHRVSGSRLASILTGLFVCLGFLIPILGRPVSPQWNLVPWLLFLFFFFQWHATRKDKHLIVAGIFFAVTVYSYPFYWTQLAVFIVCAALGEFFMERRLRIFIPYAKIIGVAAILVVPYGLTALALSGNDAYSESLARVGMLESRFPGSAFVVLLTLGSIVASLLTLRLIRAPLDLFGRLLVSNVLAVLIAANQHLFTGIYTEFSSHYQPLAAIAATALFAYSVVRILGAISPVKQKTALVGIILCVVATSFLGISDYLAREKQNLQQSNAIQKYEPVLSWLVDLSGTKEIVLAPNELASFIPAYTRHDVFFAPELVFLTISNQEITDRFAVQNFGISPTAEFLKENERSLWGVTFIDRRARVRSENKIRALFGFSEKPLPEIPSAEYERVQKTFQNLQSRDMVAELRARGVTYVVLAKDEKRVAFLDASRVGELVFQNNDFSLYKI